MSQATIVVCGVCGKRNTLHTVEDIAPVKKNEGFECGHCHALTVIDKCVDVHKCVEWTSRRRHVMDTDPEVQEIWQGYVPDDEE